MTHTILQNEYVFGKRSTKQVEYSYNLYRAVINGEDGDILDYEIALAKAAPTQQPEPQPTPEKPKKRGRKPKAKSAA